VSAGTGGGWLESDDIEDFGRYAIHSSLHTRTTFARRLLHNHFVVHVLISILP